MPVEDNTLLKSIAEHPRTAIAVPLTTAAVGQLTLIAQLQSWLTLASMCLGLMVGLILMRTRWLEMKKAELELRNHTEGKHENNR
jgi:hypothetical protein